MFLKQFKAPDKGRLVRCAVISALLAPCVSLADNANVQALDEIVVFGRAIPQIGSAKSASEGLVGFDDIQMAPLLRVGELVEAVPGMVATQHSGTGKANQYFLRGFNLDHGTDFSATANGVPLNMRTHGHGHGYLDLNFLIPELVATTRYQKGPYNASVGDFSSAGNVEFEYFRHLDEAMIGGTVGSFDYYRGLAAGSFDAGSSVLTAALDLTRYDGPWDLEENLEQNKVYLAVAGDIGQARGELALHAYDASWDASDQVPRRAVQSGLIDDLGYIDPDLGGETSRYSITGSLDFGKYEATVYIIDYELDLFSNFTYWLDDPVNGDQFEQVDKRRIYGAGINRTSDHLLGNRPATVRWGSDIRYDDIGEVGLYSTANRARLDTTRQDKVQQLSVDAWAEAEIAVTDRFRGSIGLRADFYDWDVAAFQPENSGSGSDQLLSPKLGLAYRLHDKLEGYANWGRGFHSNDVRGTTITIDPGSGDPVDPVEALVPSQGGEVGLRFENGDNFNATAVMFRLSLDSELVFVGDAGTTEPNGATERSGIELTAFWQANDWLAMHAAYTATDAKFKEDQGGGREIPGAVATTFALGMNGAWENGLRASMRLRYLGEAPLVEDDSVRSESSLLLNAGVSWLHRNLEYRLDVFNLLDSGDDDISYYYASRLAGEPAEGIDDVHFHPLEPRSIRASVSVLWE